MSLSHQRVALGALRAVRSANAWRGGSSILLQSRTPCRRHNSTEAPENPKISAIVDQISQLTLLETADLVSSLKVMTDATFLVLRCWMVLRDTRVRFADIFAHLR